MLRHPPQPATLPLAPAFPAPAITGALLCSISLTVSTLNNSRPLLIQLPKLPKVSVPKLPDIKLPNLPDLDLPNFGKKSAPKPAVPAATRAPRGTIRVRAAGGVVASGGSSDAPTLAEVTGQVTQDSIAPGDGWKRFPARRMPGANMDRWKEIAKEIGPKI